MFLNYLYKFNNVPVSPIKNKDQQQLNSKNVNKKYNPESTEEFPNDSTADDEENQKKPAAKSVISNNNTVTENGTSK